MTAFHKVLDCLGQLCAAFQWKMDAGACSVNKMRLNMEDIEQLYSDLGYKFKHTFQGYNVWLICFNEELYHKVGLKPSVRYKLNNGGLDCELLQYVIFDGRYNEMRERGEHIRNEGFRASERSKGNYQSRKIEAGDDRRPGRERRDRRDDHGDRPRRRFDDDRRRDDRPRRRHDDERRPDAGPISDEERQRRAAIARDRRMMSDVDNRDRRGRYDDDFDQEFRHSEAFAKRILRGRQPTLGDDKEVPIVHGRRKSWKRRDLDEPKEE